MNWDEYLILACKHSPSGKTFSLWYAALLLLNKLLHVCLLTDLCCKSVTSLVLDLFESICILLLIMKSSSPQIWRILGVILRTCGGINNLNVVSIISTFCVTESTTIGNPQLSNCFIVSLCRSLTEISNNIFDKTSFWFYCGYKTMTNLLERNDSFTLGWDSIPSTKYSLDSFVIVLYLEKPLIDFRVIFSIRNISALFFLSPCQISFFPMAKPCLFH